MTVQPSQDILVVDDEASVVEVVSLYLRREGYSVRSAADGQLALEAIAEQAPSLIVLDLMLPKMDGFEVLAWIRAREQFNGLPVIVLTAHNADPLIQRAKACGANGYLVKGADLDGLVHLIQNMSLGWAIVPVTLAK